MGIFARLIPAGGLGVLVTLGLLLLMHLLIQANMQGPGEVPTYRIPEIIMPEREIKTEFDTSKPVRPEEIQDTPPDIPEPDFQTPDATSNSVNIRPEFNEKIQIEGMGMSGSGDMIPLTVIQPEYPRRALQRGTEGYCTVEFTVTAAGTTRDAFIVDCPDSMFERASLRAAERIKYKPRVVDGNPVDVPGVQYRYTFEMAKD